MVYVVDGVAHPGHKPQGAEYIREPTVFGHTGPLDLSSMDLHLYVCAACPWAHRVLITRNLSHTLRSTIAVSVVSPFRDDEIGWEFLREDAVATVGKFVGLPITEDSSPLKAKTLLDVYLASTPDYTGNITTPTLYDASSGKIISNDSFGIMRVFALTVPEELGHLYADREAVDREGRQIDAELGQRVYMCGLAKTQDAYETSLRRVFDELNRLDHRLATFTAAREKTGDDRHARVAGNGAGLSLADIQLATCLVRFDAVYFDLFKCFKRRISSYSTLAPYLRSVVMEIGPTAMALDMPQIVHHYYSTFTSANPNGVVPTQAYQDDYLDGGITKYQDSRGGNDARQRVGSDNATEQDQTDASERRARGEFVRGVSAHRNWLGDEDFPVESDRYVLFVANNCPWCHRVMIARAMYSGIEDLVSVSVMFYRRGGDNRWRFLPDDPAELKDFEQSHPELLEGIDRADPTDNGFTIAPDIYKLADPDSSEASIPILFDKTTKRVVSNESADIVRMFAMQSGAYDEAMLGEIDAANARIFQDINNGACEYDDSWCASSWNACQLLD